MWYKRNKTLWIVQLEENTQLEGGTSAPLHIVSS